MKPWKSVAVALATLLVLLLPLLPLYEAAALPMDEGGLLLYPELLGKGKLPYRDFETFYGPGNITFLHGVYTLFGSSLTVERTVGLGYRLAIFAAVFWFGRRWGNACAATCTVVAAFASFFMSLIAFAWLGGVALLLWGLLVLAGPAQRWRSSLSGLLCAGAVLFRQDLGLAVLLGATPLWLLLPRRERLLFLASFAVGLAPYAIYVGVVGLGPVLDNLFIYPVLITGPGRKLPLTLHPPGAGGIVLFHAFACVLNLAASTRAVLRERRSVDSRLLLAFSLAAIGLTHQGLQRADPPHTSPSIFLSLALLPVTIPLLLCVGRDSVRWPAFAGATAALTTLVAGFAYPSTWDAVRQSTALALSSEVQLPSVIELRGRSFLYGSASNPPPRRLLRYLDQESKAGERLFVGGGDLRRSFATHTWIYYLTPWLEPATYFLEMNPFSANRPNSRLAADVSSADWLVLDQRWDHPHEPNQSTHEGSDRPNEVVREQFQPVLTVNSYGLWRRKPRTAREN